VRGALAARGKPRAGAISYRLRPRPRSAGRKTRRRSHMSTLVELRHSIHSENGQVKNGIRGIEGGSRRVDTRPSRRDEKNPGHLPLVSKTLGTSRGQLECESPTGLLPDGQVFGQLESPRKKRRGGRGGEGEGREGEGKGERGKKNRNRKISKFWITCVFALISYFCLLFLNN
jgi:hypothetical protein